MVYKILQKHFYLICLLICSFISKAQAPDEAQLGAWYMYFYNTNFKDSGWGVQGDFQYRDWRGLGDREQLLLRSGLTYTPKDSGLKLTLGYANITTGQYGKDIDNPVAESRIYQEALFSNTIWKRLLLTHRFRYEQRWVENQDFRTRYRYNIFINIPLKGTTLSKGTPYMALYNEIFINAKGRLATAAMCSFLTVTVPT